MIPGPAHVSGHPAEDRESFYEQAFETWRAVVPDDRYEGCRLGARELGRLSALLRSTSFRTDEPATTFSPRTCPVHTDLPHISPASDRTRDA